MSVYQENFFNRGPSPLARVTFFALVAIGVMIADHRYAALDAVRTAVTSLLAPVEAALQWPAGAVRQLSGYFGEQKRLLDENKTLRETVLALTAQAQRAQYQQSEAAAMTVLTRSHERISNEGVIAEIIRDARNPFARKVVINAGSRQGLRRGLAVIDGNGVVGQVTTVGLSTSEITLITELNQAVPVVVQRSGLRAIAVGTGQAGTLELPFNPLAAEIAAGDQLLTSGIDGTYPAGLQVGTVATVDKNPAFSFARIVATPNAAPNHHRFVRVLLPLPGTENAYPQSDVPGTDNSSERGGSKRDAKRGQRISSHAKDR